jgi:hypothetical protein
MSNPLRDLIATLSPQQQAAINLVHLSLDCFNSADGAGMFVGVERYNVLARRVEIAAVQADSLPRFWALLLRRMQWPVPPKAMDGRIVQLMSVPNGIDVLRVLAMETASVITLGRMAHDQDKAARRADKATERAEQAEFDSIVDPLTGEISQ